MKRATVSAGIVQSVALFATQKGVKLDQLLESASISPADLADRDGRIPFSAYQALVHEAIKETNDPAFLLKHSMDTRLKSISVVGLIVGSSASFPDAMKQLNRYAKLMVEFDIMNSNKRFDVLVQDNEFWIVDNRPDPNSFPPLTEASFGRLIGEFRHSFPDTPFALQIEMTHAEPSHATLVQSLMNCPISYGCARNALQIHPRWLAQPFDPSHTYAFGIFTDKADELLAELEKRDSVRARVEAKIFPDIHRGDFSIDAIASELGMSRTTLYRRLKDEGTTFAEVIDELRFHLASDYLSARKVSVNETAYLVGFSEASSFVRAFRRWTGKTPAEFRDFAVAAT